MAVNHNVMRLVFALGVGLALSSYMYQRVTDPAPGRQRAQEEAVVHTARTLLQAYIGSGDDLQIVDPLAPDRKVGKAYIYPAAAGWEVSGHYRRHDRDRWHPFLMQLDPESNLITLSVKDSDADLRRTAAEDPKLQAVP